MSPGAGAGGVVGAADRAPAGPSDRGEDRKGGVVITGVGTINGLAAGGADTVWSMLEDGRTAVGPVTGFATDGLGSRLACELGPAVLADLIDVGEARRLSRVCQLTVAACRIALRDAGLEDGTGVHLVVGSEFGDLRSSEEFAAGYLRRGVAGLSPLAFPNTVMNTMAAATAIALGLRGASITLNARGAAGELAVARGRDLIVAGRARAVLAGGVDEINGLMFGILDDLGVLSPRGAGVEGSYPFDRRANGVVRGEGATFVVLESFESANARGARALGELRGVARCSGPRASAVPGALAAAGLGPDEVGWVYSGASGHPTSDAVELAALRRGLGSRRPAVTALAPTFGEHAGLGALGVAAATWTARAGRLPGIASLAEPTEAARGLTVGPGVHRVAAGPGLVHHAVRGGDSVALVVAPV